MSIEDAGALEVFFAGATNVDDNIKKRLQLFEKMRLVRCATIQIMSNGVMDSPEMVEKEIRKYYSGPLPPADSMPYSLPLRDFFFGYNVLEESANALRGL